MEPLRPDERETDEALRGTADHLSTKAYVPDRAGELTGRQLDLQRRLVRESLLLRSA